MKYLLCLFIALTFVACKKNEEAAPDAGATVAGTYQMTLIGITDATGYKEITVTTPPTTATGVITAVRTDANSVNLTARAAVATSPTSTTYAVYEFNNPIPVTLQQNGSSYDMLYSGTKIGTADGTTIGIDITQPASGTTIANRTVLKGKK
ncbi:hypothetical protein [Spirosoma validum]|uniref:Uncharacterized protein n=1 Tax=Spirosoma validum TaxID=2771355 RepID=A0A927B0R8_9BACT|nr:hypothetical protein [Spirosoma validum]MBD2753441.1 hypothetical protein [Spirosoma validum]